MNFPTPKGLTLGNKECTEVRRNEDEAVQKAKQPCPSPE